MFLPKVLILLLLLTSLQNASGQKLYIQKGRKKIQILTGSLLEVDPQNNLTASATKKDSPSFLVTNITPGSISLSRPIAWKDTFRYRRNFFSGKDRIDKPITYNVPVQFEYKTYALQDISVIRYTYQRDQSGDGCVGCILIPGVNIYYFWSKSNVTRNFDMKNWKFVWK